MDDEPSDAVKDAAARILADHRRLLAKRMAKDVIESWRRALPNARLSIEVVLDSPKDSE